MRGINFYMIFGVFFLFYINLLAQSSDQIYQKQLDKVVSIAKLETELNKTLNKILIVADSSIGSKLMSDHQRWLKMRNLCLIADTENIDLECTQGITKARINKLYKLGYDSIPFFYKTDAYTLLSLIKINPKISNKEIGQKFCIDNPQDFGTKKSNCAYKLIGIYRDATLISKGINDPAEAQKFVNDIRKQHQKMVNQCLNRIKTDDAKKQAQYDGVLGDWQSWAHAECLRKLDVYRSLLDKTNSNP